MARRSGRIGRLMLLVASLLLVGLVGCANVGVPATPASQTDDLAAIRQRVTVQETRIAALETRVALPQPAVANTPKPAAPTATMVPTVAGLAVDGATKGSATAKVTITEYFDFL